MLSVRTTAGSGRAVALVLAALAGCSTLPTEPGFLMELRPVAPALAPGAPGYDETLQVHWAGSACYLIQLGELSVLTDPFVSHHGLLYSFFGGRMGSDAGLVDGTIARWGRPDAVFVGHSHWDHLLDLPTLLERPEYEGVKVYGTTTTHNLLGDHQGKFEAIVVDPSAAG